MAVSPAREMRTVVWQQQVKTVYCSGSCALVHRFEVDEREGEALRKRRCCCGDNARSVKLMATSAAKVTGTCEYKVGMQ